ncbi:hypothetical protein D3C87_1950020 [compost metagenome]
MSEESRDAVFFKMVDARLEEPSVAVARVVRKDASSLTTPGASEQRVMSHDSSWRARPDTVRLPLPTQRYWSSSVSRKAILG